MGIATTQRPSVWNKYQEYYPSTTASDTCVTYFDTVCTVHRVYNK